MGGAYLGKQCVLPLEESDMRKAHSDWVRSWTFPRLSVKTLFSPSAFDMDRSERLTKYAKLTECLKAAMTGGMLIGGSIEAMLDGCIQTETFRTIRLDPQTFRQEFYNNLNLFADHPVLGSEAKNYVMATAQVSLPLPVLPAGWAAEKDFKALGTLSAPIQRNIEPVGPHFLAHARRVSTCTYPLVGNEIDPLETDRIYLETSSPHFLRR